MSSIESLTDRLLKLNIQENSNSLNLNESLNMSISAAKEIAHTLRPFTGRSEHLEYFINSIDKFHNRYAANTTDESLKEFVFASITSKIIDEAGDFILCRPDLKTWSDLKSALRLKFGDKTDRHVLLQQLNFLCKNRNESPLEFIDRLKLLLSKISIKTHADINLNVDTKVALIQQAEATAITVLLANVSSELRTILMMQNPTTLENANKIVFNHNLIEQQINSRLNINANRPPLANPIKQKIVYQQQRNIHTPFSNFNNSQNQFVPYQPNSFK